METINYCGKDADNNFVNFFTSEKGVKLCGHKEVFKVKIRLPRNNEKFTHWSWWDNIHNKFLFTHYNKIGVTMCFPQPIEFLELECNGELLQVVVDIIQ